ncbi:hypothetical protein LP419_09360 [Massilia sp. H-1]|nr:hypothetical protein LP419_09360 [Massilia sp. H-1]
MSFPFTVHQVAGSEALAKLAELEGSGGGFPVILGDADEFRTGAGQFRG